MLEHLLEIRFAFRVKFFYSIINLDGFLVELSPVLTGNELSTIKRYFARKGGLNETKRLACRVLLRLIYLQNICEVNLGRLIKFFGSRALRLEHSEDLLSSLLLTEFSELSPLLVLITIAPSSIHDGDVIPEFRTKIILKNL